MSGLTAIHSSAEQTAIPSVEQLPSQVGYAPGLGYSLAVLSVLCNAVAIHIFRRVLDVVPPYTLMPLNVAVGIPAFLLLAVLWRRRGWRAANLERLTPASMLRAMHTGGWQMALSFTIGGVGGLLYLVSLKHFGPDLSSFLGNGTVVILVLAGLYGRERLSALELATIAAIVVGAFTFSWRGGNLAWGALGLMALSCCGTAVKHLSVKYFSMDYGIGTMVAVNMTFMGLTGLVSGLVAGAHMLPPIGMMGLIVVGTLIGPVLGMTMLYGSYTLIGVSRGAPIDAMRPLAVLVISIVLGMADLGPLQLLGGLAMLIGSALLASQGTRKR